MKKLLFFLLLISNMSWAGPDQEAFMGYGVGVFHDADNYLGQNKYLEAGYRSLIWDGLYLQFKGGCWGDNSWDPTRKSGCWISSGAGLEVDLQPIEIRSGWSLGAISSPDSQLGGRFPQFNGSMSLGLRDKKGDGIALEYNHISSAGLVTPNRGRDFVILELSQKW